MLDRALMDLIGRLYEVAVAPALSQSWLGSLCDAIAVQAGVLIVRFTPGIGDHGVFAVGLPELAAEEGAARPSPPPPASATPAPYLGYLADDSRLFSKALTLTPGELPVLSEVLPDEKFTATRFYREWMGPHELHHLVSMIVSRTPKHITGLSLLRRPGRLHIAQEELEMAEQVLESVRCGAIRLDETGRVCNTNRHAAALLERGEGIAEIAAALVEPGDTPPHG